MKCEIIIDKKHDEGVFIYINEPNENAEKIKKFIEDLDSVKLIGYSDKEAKIINFSDVVAFITEESKVFAITDNSRWQLKERLYQIEELADGNFVKLNQSCIGNINKILFFDASISGSLIVNFKNGYREYISRRQMKTVKERLGMKK